MNGPDCMCRSARQSCCGRRIFVITKHFMIITSYLLCTTCTDCTDKRHTYHLYGQAGALDVLREAYEVVRAVDVWDTSKEGIEAWATALELYNARVDQVELLLLLLLLFLLLLGGHRPGRSPSSCITPAGVIQPRRPGGDVSAEAPARQSVISLLLNYAVLLIPAVRQVETQMTTSLRNSLGAARDAKAMFNIFSVFNPLLVRAKIRSAIQV